ncbi:MAG: efflux RND transporter periplasmic adaptor subunit, partial [Dokdonella sp.]
MSPLLVQSFPRKPSRGPLNLSSLIHCCHRRASVDPAPSRDSIAKALGSRLRGNDERSRLGQHCLNRASRSPCARRQIRNSTRGSVQTMRKSPFILIASASLVLAACTSKEPAERGRVSAPAIPVTTALVEPMQWVDTIEAVGTTKARESITLTAKISDTVRKINFQDGQHVDAGDVLVELTSGQQVAALAEAQATFKDAERLMSRNNDLVSQGTVSRQVADTERATHDSAQARVAVLRAQLADRVVPAPFSGVLGLRQVSVGALVTPGTVITTLDDIDTVKLDFSLAERYLAAVRTGLAIVVTTAAYTDRRFEGTVISVDSRVDPMTRSFLVRAEMPNADHALRAGMLMTVKLLQPAREVLGVPEI